MSSSNLSALVTSVNLMMQSINWQRALAKPQTWDYWQEIHRLFHLLPLGRVGGDVVGVEHMKERLESHAQIQSSRHYYEQDLLRTQSSGELRKDR